MTGQIAVILRRLEFVQRGALEFAEAPGVPGDRICGNLLVAPSSGFSRGFQIEGSDAVLGVERDFQVSRARPAIEFEASRADFPRVGIATFNFVDEVEGGVVISDGGENVDRFELFPERIARQNLLFEVFARLFRLIETTIKRE